jgi:hypothetical protein
MPKKRVVIVTCLAELPHAELLMEIFELPASLAQRAVYLHLQKDEHDLFEVHPERSEVAAHHVDLAMQIGLAPLHADKLTVGDVLDPRGASMRLALVQGLHLDLDKPAAVDFFRGKGWKVVGLEVLQADPLSAVLGAIEPDERLWELVGALLERGVPMGRVVHELSYRELPPAPRALLLALGEKLDPADLGRYQKLLEKLGEDLVTWALPVLQRRYGTRGGAPTEGLPPDLAALLARHDGLLELGLMSSAEIERTQKERAPLSSRRLRWEQRSERVRADRAWREGWIPFWSDGSDGLLCIDQDPSRAGTKGQVIGVSQDPPGLHHVARSLGEWLWQRLCAG